MVSRLFKATGLLVLLLQSATASEPAHSFSGMTMNGGQAISLDEYRGKVVFLDFWASWCVPCLTSLPIYEEMRGEIGTDEFEIIAINVDEYTDDGMAFLEEHPVTYPVIADPDGDIGIPYGIRTLPHSFLLDRDGHIVASFRSFKTGDEVRIKTAIQELLKK